MDTEELRNQAKRWRSRVPGADEQTAEALVDAARSFEGLAQDQERDAAAKAREAGEFMHRAYGKQEQNKQEQKK